MQPSELAKFALVLYGAYLLAEKPKRARSIEGMLPYLLLTGFACLLIVLEPDLGSAIVAPVRGRRDADRRRGPRPAISA